MHDPFELRGKTLEDKYRVDEVVGEGGFGVVYRGWHLGFDHAIAIKCLKIPGHFTTEARRLFLEKFREEGKLLSRLAGQHLSIVRVYDYDVWSGPGGADVPYLVLEWIDGDSLAKRLEEREEPLGEADAIALLRPAIEAIAVAHGMKVAHRDLKPANLLLSRGAGGERIKVLDFGIAKAMQEGETATQVATRTSSGFSAFSPPYGAPEQFQSKKYGATGPWTDVHALGLILCELVTGRAPLDGDEQYELFAAATSGGRPTPRARGAEVSDAFEAVCAKAVALGPSDRYADAGALLAALDAIDGAEIGASETVLQMPNETVMQVPDFAAPKKTKGEKKKRDKKGKRPMAAAPIEGDTVKPVIRKPPAPAEQPKPFFGTEWYVIGGVVAVGLGMASYGWITGPADKGGDAPGAAVSGEAEDSGPPKTPADLAAPPADAKKTGSGLAYKYLKHGTGTTHPKATDRVKVHYSGWDKSGKMFDSSVTRGAPAEFALNQVIRGWTEGVQLMVPGDKCRFWIPAAQAYGEKPMRPGAPAGDLVFDVELLAIE
jgi:serine/threonine protein kinase